MSNRPWAKTPFLSLFLHGWARPFFIVLVSLINVTQAHALDAYDPAIRELTIPSLQIGSAIYSNIVVTVGRIVSGPSGSAANGTLDKYNPGTGQLTVQSVAIGATIYNNVVVTVASLVSIGGVTGADVFDGSTLTVAQVQAGGAVYENVVINEAGGTLLSIGGGMPTAGPDTYGAATNQLSIPAVQFGNHVYTNIVVTLGQITSVGGMVFQNQKSSLYSSAVMPSGFAASALIQGNDGNFYGTTESGILFRITPGGVATTLYSFGAPVTTLIEGGDGNFYGTVTPANNDAPFMFELTADGVETVLFSLPEASNGSPGSSILDHLMQARDGNFYLSGLSGSGVATLFKLTPGGEVTLLDSVAFTDGFSGVSGLIQGSDGNVYGTTGGNAGGTQIGSVFKVTPGGVVTPLCSLGAGGFDADASIGGLIQGGDGNFYMTNALDGANNRGLVFRVTPDGAVTQLYSFGAYATDGWLPKSLIQGSDGNFYGLTYGGGTFDQGTLFKLTPGGVETVLFSFPSSDSDPFNESGPYSLVQGSDGNFYGLYSETTDQNGGRLFKVTNFPFVP